MNAANSVDEEINQYLPHLNAKQKQAVLTVVKTFVEEQADWWDEMGPEQQALIDQALTEMRNGDVTPHEEVMQNYSQWRKK
jgi:predicted transcriptional regulator